MSDHAYDITSLREYTVKDWKAGHQAYLLPNLSPVDVYLLAQRDESNPDLVPWACTSAYDQVIRLSLLRTVPLCWVEGKAAYKGDTLYVKNNVRVEPVKVFDRKGQELVRVQWRIDGQLTKTTLYTTNLTWNKPENKEPTMQETAKDFSTLRPYTKSHETDLQQACDSKGNTVEVYIKSKPDSELQTYGYLDKDDKFVPELYAMPVAWVEGKALYLGDKVYYNSEFEPNPIEGRVTAIRPNDVNWAFEFTPSAPERWVKLGAAAKNLSWTNHQVVKNPTDADGDTLKYVQARIELLEKELSLFKSMLSILQTSQQLAVVKSQTAILTNGVTPPDGVSCMVGRMNLDAN